MLPREIHKFRGRWERRRISPGFCTEQYVCVSKCGAGYIGKERRCRIMKAELTPWNSAKYPGVDGEGERGEKGRIRESENAKRWTFNSIRLVPPLFYFWPLSPPPPSPHGHGCVLGYFFCLLDRESQLSGNILHSESSLLCFPSRTQRVNLLLGRRPPPSPHYNEKVRDRSESFRNRPRSRVRENVTALPLCQPIFFLLLDWIGRNESDGRWK